MLWKKKGQVLVSQIHIFLVNLILNQAEDQLKAQCKVPALLKLMSELALTSAAPAWISQVKKKTINIGRILNSK